MAYASTSGRARTSAKSPRAFAVCQRCSRWYNRVNLNFQYQWRGAQLTNTYILVCKECMDVPTEQLRAITLPADPTPIYYPSVEDFLAADTNWRSTSQTPVYDPETGIPIPSTTLRVTEDCNNRTTLPFGIPVGFNQNAVMPYNGAIEKAFGIPLSLLSVSANGTDTIVVTTSAVHNLHTDDQISVQGLAYRYANGFYSVTVMTATMFTYMTYAPTPAQALLTPTTRIVTALVGLPRGYTTIPKIYAPAPFESAAAGDDAWELENELGFFLLEDGVIFFGLER